jgi:hypothetical protein
MENSDGLASIPLLFFTNNGGKNWKEIKVERVGKSLTAAYLHGDSLICRIDSSILLSIDKGQHFIEVRNSFHFNDILNNCSPSKRYIIQDHKFIYNGKQYYQKEQFQNNLASVIVCYGDEALTDYYFASFDSGKNWIFLQKRFGDNKARFLLDDRFLFCYDFPFGLQRLKLK